MTIDLHGKSVEELREFCFNNYNREYEIPPWIVVFNELVRRIKKEEQQDCMRPIGWIQEIDGKQVFFSGDLDPREVHDNGKSCYRVYVKDNP